MLVNGLGTSTNDIDEIRKKLRVHQEGNPEAASADIAPQGDPVEISEEGMQKAQAMKGNAVTANAQKNEAASEDTAQSDADTESNSAGAAASVNVDELKQSLQKKKSEVNAKQAKLDAAKRAAENDPAQESEVKKLQNQVSRLEKEAKKIKTEIYSS